MIMVSRSRHKSPPLPRQVNSPLTQTRPCPGPSLGGDDRGFPFLGPNYDTLVYKFGPVAEMVPPGLLTAADEVIE
jgi:hypothetical protein